MIDLHVHSTVSDGTYTPRDIIHLAKERGLEAVTLTDHESIAGNQEAAEEAQKVDMNFINGMEMTVAYEDHKLHIVCLGFDQENPDFKELYAKIRHNKEKNMDQVVEYIRSKGVKLTMDMVQKHATVHLDRYAIMRTLVAMNLPCKIQTLWDELLNPGLKVAGVYGDIPAEEALPVIKAAGGVTSLAHYHKAIGMGGWSWVKKEAALQELMSYGLMGMERYYPNYSEEDEAFAARMIEKYNMLATGGTDFHGANRRGIELGTGLNNNMNVPYEFWEEIKRRIP
ncbi:putative metal-dependent phosphoesterases (PHP family) [Anaerovibrio sp. JC8]|uniref:PHP domain-containing protein n=1 Tax=Anaerovibrio sp. JC8 TaxID=1240085 RepID=UPI000A0C4AB0|nr:PHP domain-containing protein [Anaerovibrio sp. JC8]ORU01477.1 putative metal-dependent phosphoesterases (PHP family) [Anaerovibrio sp. JC8]